MPQGRCARLVACLGQTGDGQPLPEGHDLGERAMIARWNGRYRNACGMALDY